MSYSDLIGTMAAICTTVSFVPQVLKVRRTRHARDLSFPMYIIFSSGVFLWACYGVMMKSLPIITANSIMLFFCFYIIFMKLRYK